MNSTLIQFPGSNRDRDMIAALTKISGQSPALVWHTETQLPATDLIVIPVGFPMVIICALVPLRRALRSWPPFANMRIKAFRF